MRRPACARRPGPPLPARRVHTGFFETLPPVPEPPEHDEVEHAMPEWFAPPQQVMGAIVPLAQVVLRTEHVFIGLRWGVELADGRRTSTLSSVDRSSEVAPSPPVLVDNDGSGSGSPRTIERSSALWFPGNELEHAGSTHPVEVEVTYADGTTAPVELALDRRGEVGGAPSWGPGLDCAVPCRGMGMVAEAGPRRRYAGLEADGQPSILGVRRSR